MDGNHLACPKLQGNLVGVWATVGAIEWNLCKVEVRARHQPQHSVLQVAEVVDGRGWRIGSWWRWLCGRANHDPKELLISGSERLRKLVERAVLETVRP